jgi:hypothetical protein
MSDITYENLRKSISENLNASVREFGKTVGDISRNFRGLGLEAAVWYPEKIHTINLGGVVAESYFGYSRIEGKWGLVIRTIERDCESGAFVSQRVYTIESSRNIEVVANALKKTRELMHLVLQATDKQLEILSGLGNELQALRNPDCEF